MIKNKKSGELILSATMWILIGFFVIIILTVMYYNGVEMFNSLIGKN